MYVLAPNQITEKFPYSIGDLRKDNPQISFPANPSLETLASYNVFPVVSTGAQHDPATQVAEQSGCLFNADRNRWETTWTVRDLLPEEIQSRIDAQLSVIRKERNAKLSATDWTQVADAPVNALEWAIYRQALRDVTLQDDPFNITWPEEPN